MNVSNLQPDSLNNSTDSSQSDQSRRRDSRRALPLRGATDSVYSFFSEVNAEVFNNSNETSTAQILNSFNMLASSTEDFSETSASNLLSRNGSESSGVTIYADATSSTDGDSQTQDISQGSSLDFLREHVTWQRESTSGLVTVKPIKSPYRLSQALTDSLENSMTDLNRSLRDVKSESTNNLNTRISTTTPATSRREKSHRKLCSHSSLSPDEGYTSNVCSPQSPQSRKRAPLTSLSPSDINAQRSSVISRGEGSPISKRLSHKENKTDGSQKSLRLVFGKPHAAVKPDSSSREDFLPKKSSKNKHLPPERVVAGVPPSIIRRAGDTVHSSRSFIQGFPHLPLVPFDHTALKNDTRPSLLPIINSGDVERDLWGRKMAGGLRSCLLLAVATLFPPLLLFLAFGYFDTACGTIDRSVKVIATALAALTFTAATALAVTFALLGH